MVAPTVFCGSDGFKMTAISRLTLRPNMALFLDFDGTLAPICYSPDAVRLSPLQSDLLLKCADYLDGAVAIISGRDLRDLANRVPDGLWRGGNHGMYVAGPNKIVPLDLPKLPAALSQKLETLIKKMEGVWLERKGPVAAIHFRAAPQYEEAILDGVREILSRFSDYKRQHGNMIVEAKPLSADKGRFIRNQMRLRPFSGRVPVMIGDDTTDEDAFAAVQELEGLAVKVGPGESCAKYRASRVSDVYELLRRVP